MADRFPLMVTSDEAREVRRLLGLAGRSLRGSGLSRVFDSPAGAVIHTPRTNRRPPQRVATPNLVAAVVTAAEVYETEVDQWVYTCKYPFTVTGEAYSATFAAATGAREVTAHNWWELTHRAPRVNLDPDGDAVDEARYLPIPVGQPVLLRRIVNLSKVSTWWIVAQGAALDIEADCDGFA